VKLGGFFLNTPWGDRPFRNKPVACFREGAGLPRGQENQFAKNYTAFSSRFRFNGKEWDEETGNFYYGARYYDPKISVWLSVDRLANKYPGMSPYNFTMNNPLNLIDPNGDSVNVASLVKYYSDVWARTKADLEAIGGVKIGVSKKGNITVEMDENAEGFSEDARSQMIKMFGASESENFVNVMPVKGESKGGGRLVRFGIEQIQGFIDGTSNDLDSRTLGYGMTLLHELGHTNVGGSLLDLSIGNENGANVRRMNRIRSQLGESWGQRYYQQHSPASSNMDYIPFSKYSNETLKRGNIPTSRYIEIKRKKVD